ncbi:type II secretion system F family protein [Ferviditalea candida]|uniref:Type II secretion system F family protein n=1 Tax=Ferviditalea candida TaxID=3108399 RepID=A0ABU5ZCP5_9BACL|nr:type II secretion system F family protein [Paenibacillaceae bacterium T2]
MIWLIHLMFMMTAFLFFLYILQKLFMSNKRLEKRIERYLAVQDKKGLDRKRFNLLVQLQLYKRTVREQVLTKKKNDKLGRMLERAGVSLKPEEYILFQWIATALGGGLFLLFSGRVPLVILGAVAGYMLPGWWIRQKQKQRLNKFNDGLPDMITTLIGSLRAGFSFAQSLKAVVEDSESPIREEIEQVLKEMQYGTTMEDALQQLKERMPSEDLDLMIQTILIQKQIGGNLATVLQTIVQTIRDRNRIQRQVQTLTAQGKLSGNIIALLPVALGVVIYLIQPEYIDTLFTNQVGWILLAVGAVSGTVGWILIRKLTRIEV